MTPSQPSRTLIRVQAASGLALAVFVSLHLLNLLSANLGPETYDGLQRALRPLYQFAPYEVLGLMGALVTHVAAGAMRIRERRRRTREAAGAARPAAWTLRLHRLSAYYLVAVVFLHAAATRLPSLLFEVHPESPGLAFALWWMPWLFYPYYVLLALAGAYHLLHGLGVAGRAVGLRWVPAPSRRTRTLTMGALSVGIVGAVLALGGVTHDIPDPRDNDYARIYERLLGVDLRR